MEFHRYILLVATFQSSVEVHLAIRNIAGTRQALCGRNSRSNKSGDEALWIVPKSRKSKEELLTQLRAVPLIQHVSVVELDKPITGTTLSEVRALFNSFDLDTSEVNDELLSLFLDAKLQGKLTYILEFDYTKRRAPAKIRIIKAEEHPDFSPEWLTAEREEEILDRELTIDDVKLESVVIRSTSLDTPPPPPPPPTNA